MGLFKKKKNIFNHKYDYDEELKKYHQNSLCLRRAHPREEQPTQGDDMIKFLELTSNDGEKVYLNATLIVHMKRHDPESTEIMMTSGKTFIVKEDYQTVKNMMKKVLS